jgi:hypothetical protein
MKRTLLWMTLVLLFSAGQASAQMLYIEWESTRQIQFLFDGSPKFANAGAAIGHLDPVNANPAANPMAEALGYIYCVDLSNLANSGEQYDVSVHYDDTGWLDPPGDDGLRRSDGLYRAAWLANRFSNEASSSFQKRVALGVAIWEAAYGDYFTYQSGLLTSELAYYNSYLAEWNGQQSMSVRWFDNDTDGIYHQDFIQGVPEPSTLVLLGGGLLGVALLRRRRYR